MAGSLFGEIVNSCDSVTGFSAGAISGDDDFAQGTGALGAKVSNTFTAFYTTSLGATAPYNFASAGSKFGWHMIMWFSAKSKVSATSGYRLIVGNGTSRGQWDVPPVTSELKRNGAFLTRVIDLARNFSRISAGSWTTTGNPAQLSNITQMGGGIETIVAIMGSFNNAQIDQITIGLGIRLSGGTVGTPDTFEVARLADEGTGIWGWSQGRVLKGGIYIGPATGSASSIFTSIRETRVFAASPVAVGFFRIEARGAGTEVTLQGANISAEDPAVARWNYTVGATTLSWDDTNSVYSGINVMTLQSSAVLTGLRIVNANTIIQNGATIDNVSFSELTNPVQINDVTVITNSVFTSDGTGHGWVIAEGIGNIVLSNISFIGYGADSTADAAINYTGTTAITLSFSGGTTPTVNGNITVLSNQITITFTGLIIGGEFRIYDDDLDGNDITLGTDREGIETLTQTTYEFTYPIADAGDIINAQFMDPENFEEQVRKITLPSVSQNIAFDLQIENNV